ncbi:transcriptional regulator [Amycolatopsis sp. NPDC003865]
MTASPQTSPGSGRALVEPTGEVADWLAEELRNLAGEQFDKLEPDLRRDRPGTDLGEVRRDVVTRVVEDRSALRNETRAQSDAVDHAEQTLAVHRESPVPPAGPPDVRDKRAHAALGATLWIGVISPLVFWQLLQTPLSSTGHFWVSAAVVVAGLATLFRPAPVAVAWAGRRLTGEPAGYGASWPFITVFLAVFLLSLWRLWTPSIEALGPVFAAVIWGVAAVLAMAAAFLAFGLAIGPAKAEEARGGRIPDSVFGRELGVAVVAITLSALVLTGVVPVSGPDWVTWLAADLLSLVVLVLGGPLLLGPRVPRWLSGDVTRKFSRGWKRRLGELEQRRDDLVADWRKEAVGPVLQRVVFHTNAVHDPPFSTTLPSYAPGALGHMRAEKPVARKTAAGKKLEMTLAGISGGAIGVAGPRGSGKSTWLEVFRQGKLLAEENSKHIALLESVPVRYDMREFVLHLYAGLCEAVIEFCDRAGVTTAEPPGSRDVWRTRFHRWWPFAAIVVAWLVLGLAGSLSLRDPKADVRAWLTSLWWPVVSLVAAGAALAVALRGRPGVAAGPPASPSGESRHDADPRTLPELRREAAEQLDEIRFQQKHTSGWSGKLGVLAGAELGLSGSRERTRQPRSYPEIVREFGAFLKATVECVRKEPDVATPSVVIILDELDKIASPEDAQDFVNEIKSLVDVGVQGFLLLVSVSEDALASFERRGLPVRNAFDSTFDVILRLEYLTLGEAKEMLSSRVLGLPDPFTCLAHCLSGGLPRELIRTAREMIRESGSLPEVSGRMVGGDLRNKLGALRTVVAHGAYDDVIVSDLVRHVDAHAVADPAVLLRAVRQPPITVGAELVPLYRLQLETLGYLYYLATVLEVFGAGFSPADFERGREEGDGSFDTLSSVRQLFAVNARLAWLTVSAFREAWGFETVPPPG